MAPSPTELDAALESARHGDRQAMERVMASVAPSIYRFGLRMCRNVHDAEDVLQDTLLAVAQHLDDFEGRSAFSSWVFSLARSACARRRRGLKNRPGLPAEALAHTEDPAPNPENTAVDRELAATLTSALDHLTDDHREVILLRDVEGLSAPEAAESLGISLAALKSRLHRAREALRVELRPRLEPQGHTSATGCPDVVELWSKKLEGDLSRLDCAEMEKHVEGCPACRSACTALKEALLACENVREERVPPAVQARVKAALRAWSPQTTR